VFRPKCWVRKMNFYNNSINKLTYIYLSLIIFFFYLRYIPVHEITFSTWQKSFIKKGRSTIKNELSSQTETLESSCPNN